MTKKNVQDDMRESAHKIWLAGLGALATAEQEGSKMFKKLVDKGAELEGRGRGRVDDAREKVGEKVGEVWDEAEGVIDEKIATVLHTMGVPTREEIRNLTRRVEELSAKVEKLKPAAKPQPAATTAAKPKTRTTAKKPLAKAS